MAENKYVDFSRARNAKSPRHEKQQTVPAFIVKTKSPQKWIWTNKKPFLFYHYLGRQSNKSLFLKDQEKLEPGGLSVATVFPITFV